MGRAFRFAQRVAFCVECLPWLGLSLLAVLTLSSALVGQASQGQTSQDSKAVVHLPTDWSHHHLIFSNPGTEEEAIAKGTHDRWLKIVNDPRYILQQMKRSSGVKALRGPETASWGQEAKTESIKKGKGTKIRKDWSEPLAAGQVQPNMYPAKYSFSITTASCSTDFVVYPTGVAGAGAAASIIAYNDLYSGCAPATVPSVYWAYNTGGTISTSPIISLDGTQLAFIQSNGTTASLVLLKWAPNPTPPTGVKGTFINNSTIVFITAGTVTTADVGMQISGTGIPANDTIVGVSGSTVTLATATTANTSGAETLTISAEAVTTPGVAPTVSNANYQSCTAPCMTTLSYANSQDYTFSAPFYDFASDDAIYVGDDDGYLHQFTGVFSGTPAESGSPWPVQVNTTAGTQVSSPVYDPTSGYVFVGDSTGVLHAVAANGSTHGTSSVLGDTIIDGPLVDPTAGMVYAFVTTNTADSDNAVFQFSTSFTTGTGNGAATGTETGKGGPGYYLYSGTFDNVYYESSSGASPSGNLYVIGGTGVAGGAILYQIAITGNAMAATATSPVTLLSGKFQLSWPSPLTEFCNAGAGACALNAGGTATATGTDYLFFSIYHSAKGGCTNLGGNGCILSYDISDPTHVVISGTGLNVTAEANPGCWATSGIEVDNSVPSGTLAGASQIYFVNLNGNGAGGPTNGTYTSTKCGANSVANTIQAVQASQASP